MENPDSHYERLFALTELLGQQQHLPEILRVISTHTTSLLDAEVAAILLLNPNTDRTLKTVHRDGQILDQKNYRLVQDLITGWMLNHDGVFVTDDIRRDDRFRAGVLSDAPVASVFCAPLRHKGKTVGFLQALRAPDHAPFSAELCRLGEHIAMLAAPYLADSSHVRAMFKPELAENSLIKKYSAMGLLGSSPRFIELLRAIESAAPAEVRVFIEGETGTGKERVARALHECSERSDQAFVAVDCGAMPSHLVESELFGHVRGAFTGADRDRHGLIRESDGGTLFLDEIANLPLDAQSKLMRVLQENEVRPIGGNQTFKVNLRLIAASSTSLSKLVAEHKFRQDLFYRLFVYPIFLPALNERGSDITLLAAHFLEQIARRQNKGLRELDPGILNYMQQHPWPGNIRELQNFVERLVTLAAPDVELLETSMLPLALSEEILKMEGKPARLPESGFSLQQALQEYERSILQQALSESDWNQSAAARKLGLPEQTLRFKMKKLGIRKP